ncbi:MAG: hypothetical protein AABO57_10905 [Acidobacteriota bacterium]
MVGPRGDDLIIESFHNVICYEIILLINSAPREREVAETCLLNDRRLQMGATLSADVLEDDIAVSLARVLASANKRARELNKSVPRSLITITQLIDNGPSWRIDYGPKDYVGRRGGDLVIEVDATDASIKQVLRGR